MRIINEGLSYFLIQEREAEGMINLFIALSM